MQEGLWGGHSKSPGTPPKGQGGYCGSLIAQGYLSRSPRVWASPRVGFSGSKGGIGSIGASEGSTGRLEVARATDIILDYHDEVV